MSAVQGKILLGRCKEDGADIREMCAIRSGGGERNEETVRVVGENGEKADARLLSIEACWLSRRMDVIGRGADRVDGIGVAAVTAREGRSRMRLVYWHNGSVGSADDGGRPAQKGAEMTGSVCSRIACKLAWEGDEMVAETQAEGCAMRKRVPKGSVTTSKPSIR